MAINYGFGDVDATGAALIRDRAAVSYRGALGNVCAAGDFWVSAVLSVLAMVVLAVVIWAL
ncbi:MAG: hypothetical protein QJR12_08960 [Mycobacterium sp.]|uniref:hypothetical protein n=1 Tax=Mycobacterium sp. TaxID=1785 RepID=UPI00262EB7A5|nr:hypothetical protein [Mycobacterium sp.]MDI3314392.1 hypothetical protein [Mycobacterium sp.]